MELNRLTSSFHGADTSESPDLPRLRVVAPDEADFLQPVVALPEDVVSDDTLNAAMVAGETSALGALYDRHAHIVFALLLRILRDRTAAEDLLQEVFLRAWQQADLFDETRGTMRCWLYSMAHNLALNELRRRGRRPQLHEPAASDADDGDKAFAALVDPGTDPADDACYALRNAQIAAVLAQLPPPSASSSLSMPPASVNRKSRPGSGSHLAPSSHACAAPSPTSAWCCRPLGSTATISAIDNRSPTAVENRRSREP